MCLQGLSSEKTFSKHEAVSAVLHGGLGYVSLDLPVGGLALYDPARLSVPDYSVSLEKLLREDARDCVWRWSELMLISENEQKFVDATSLRGSIRDPMLAGSRLACKSFIRALFGKGLVRFSRTPKFHCTCFFVNKKQVASV